MIDFTGGALKNGKKKNIFDDVIERRRDEGNFMRVFFPSRHGKDTSQSVVWAKRGLRFMTVALGAIMLAIFLVLPGKQEDHLPGDSQSAVAGAGGAESGAPVNPARTGPAPAPLASGKTVFHPMEPEFTPLRRLDIDLLGNAWDDQVVITKTPWIGNNIKAEWEIVDHLYRYLRTYTEAELAARADPDLTHYQLLTDPDSCRGEIMRMRAVLLRKYKIYGWRPEEGRELKSGVRDTTMLFVRNATPGKNPYIYVVLVSEPPWKFVEREIYEFTGIFMKRFPYKRRDNLWETQPLLVTTDLKPALVTSQDSWHVTVAILVAVLLVMIVLYFAVRGETRESEEKRRERIERRKVSRGRLRQRIESERVRKVSASPGEESTDDPGPSEGAD